MNRIRLGILVTALVSIYSLNGMKPTTIQSQYWNRAEGSFLVSVYNPLSIEHTIMQLAQKGDFKAINELVTHANNEQIQEMLMLQLNLAIFIAARVNFGTSRGELFAFSHPEQKIIENPYDKEKNPIQWFSYKTQAQWLYLLLYGLKEVSSAREINAENNPYQWLLLIEQFLMDIGFDIHFKEYFFDITSLKPPTSDQIKKALSNNFKLLFEAFSYVVERTPTKGTSLYGLISKMLHTQQ